MTPQERQLIDDLFDRLSRVENTPRDREAVAAIAQGLRIAPNAVYALVQTVLVQDEALKRANSRILELEQVSAQDSGQGSSGFLDSMREKMFGPAGQSRGSVPNVPPPDEQGRPVWNSGQVMQQAAPPPLPPSYGQAYGGQPYGAPQSPIGGGGSFLGTAAAAAAGMVGGSLLLNGIRSMMGGQRHGFGDSTIAKEGAASQAATPSSNPWSDQSGSPMARDLGVGDIGRAGDRADDGSKAGLYDQASNDDSMNDNDMYGEDPHDLGLDSDDFDSDDFGGGDDDGSSYA